MLTVGRVTKAHGLHGEVVVHLWTDVVDRLAPGTVLASSRGPLRVVASRPMGGERDRFLVHFEGVEDRNGAERLHGVDLLAEPLEEPGTLWVHELVGASVVEVSSGSESEPESEPERGRDLGRVEAVEANPASDLLVLETGVLIPVRFVRRFLPEDHVVEVEIPEGLLEL